MGFDPVSVVSILYALATLVIKKKKLGWEAWCIHYHVKFQLTAIF